jgi:hypothetical protein
MVQNYKHLYFSKLLKSSDLCFFDGIRLATPFSQGTRLQTPLPPKVQDYKHLYRQRYKIGNTFAAQGTRLQTPLPRRAQDYRHLYPLKVQNYKHLYPAWIIATSILSRSCALTGI